MQQTVLNRTGFDRSKGIWVLDGFGGIPYSDGVEAENYVLECVRKATDLSSTSEELTRMARDWPSQYHLSNVRSLLLRGFDLDPSSSALEIGCGCGAITRFLGERVAETHAVEGSLLRAEIAAARCRDLPGVSVMAAPVHELHHTRTYDLVICVGVLEYSRSFIGGEDPVRGCLEHLRGLVSPWGALVVAIENQFGLKYFSGCSEDHTAVHFDGIEGYGAAGDEGPVTFGRQELQDRLERAGFRDNRFYLAFPDYKLPQCLMDDGVASRTSANLGGLVRRLAPRDYSRKSLSLFSDALAWWEIGKNRNLSTFSPSFLVVSRPGEDGVRIRADWDAVLFSPSRARAYRTRTTFHDLLSGEGRVMKRAMFPDAARRLGTDWDPAPFVQGIPLDILLLKAAKHRTRARELFADRLRTWVASLERFLVDRPDRTGGVPSPDALLSGRSLDATPWNVVVSGGDAVYIDLEWTGGKDLPVRYLFARFLFHLMASEAAHLKSLLDPSEPTMGRWMDDCFRAVWPGATVDWRGEFLDLESAFMAEVHGHDPAAVREAYARNLGGSSSPRPGAGPEVSIVIPVFNGLGDTRGCLAAIERNTREPDFEVIVVDNASKDGTPEFLRSEAQRWGARLRVLRHDRNLGFARGCNAGAGVAGGNLLLFLNNDTTPQPGWLREMAGVLQSDERVGIVGSKLLYPDTNRVQHAGIELINGAPDHVFRNAAADDPRVCRARDLDMVTGACLMVRKGLFDRLGGFDEEYVNGVEDVDLCLRVREEGYRVVYCPTSVVYHHEGRSAGRFDRVQENLRRFASRWNGRFDAGGRFVPAQARTSPPLRGIWEGSFFVRHSLALVNREVAGAMARSGRCELSLVPYETDEFGPEEDPGRLQPLADRMGAALSGPAEFHVRHQWPPNFQAPPAGRWVMIQPWEFGRLPKAWVRPMTEQVDEIWAYTSFVKRCYVESGVPAERVFVVPLGVNGALFHPEAEQMALPTAKSFRFLFVGGTIYRKGPDVLLDAYVKAFRRTDDVCLVIKDMGQTTFYKGQSACEGIRALQQDPDAPEILYLTDSLSDREVAGLYAACDCLVHPYRGEGFGLPVAEAMACGLPAIVTRGGACDDFCSEETAYFIPSRRVEVAFQEETAGPAWLLEPDREALVEHMRWVRSHEGEAKAKGLKASAHVRANLTWERTASAAMERLRALRDRPVVRAGRGMPEATAEPKAEVTIVLTRSRPDRTETALEKLGRHAGRPCEVATFDAAGKDLMAFLGERWEGFSGRAVAVISDRVVVTPGALGRLLEVLDADPSAIMAVPSSNVGSGGQGAKPGYRNLDKDLEKFARKVAHDRHGMADPVALPEAPCVMLRREALTFPSGLRTDAGLVELARVMGKSGRRVICARDAYVHVDPSGQDDPDRLREADAVRHLAEADAAEAEGNLERSIRSARSAVESAPDWAVAHNDLGRHLYRAGDPAGARVAFERAAGVAPRFAEAHSNLGVLLWEAGESERAVEAFSRAAEAEPDNVDVLYNVGMVYTQIGDPERAAIFFKQCLDLKPEDADIRAQLEAALATAGRKAATA